MLCTGAPLLRRSTEDSPSQGAPANSDDDRDVALGEVQDVPEKTSVVKGATDFFCLHFLPLHYFYGFDETFSTRTYYSVVIDLPAGCTNSYELVVINSGHTIQLTVSYLKAMVHVGKIHRHLLQPKKKKTKAISRDHPRIGACVKAIKKVRPDGKAPIKAVAYISMPVAVETDFRHKLLQFKSGGDILYVTVQTAADVYSGRSQRQRAIVYEDKSDESDFGDTDEDSDDEEDILYDDDDEDENGNLDLVGTEKQGGLDEVYEHMVQEFYRSPERSTENVKGPRAQHTNSRLTKRSPGTPKLQRFPGIGRQIGENAQNSPVEASSSRTPITPRTSTKSPAAQFSPSQRVLPSPSSNNRRKETERPSSSPVATP